MSAVLLCGCAALVCSHAVCMMLLKPNVLLLKPSVLGQLQQICWRQRRWMLAYLQEGDFPLGQCLPACITGSNAF